MISYGKVIGLEGYDHDIDFAIKIIGIIRQKQRTKC